MLRTLTPSMSSLMGQAGVGRGGGGVLSVSRWWELSAEEGVRKEGGLPPQVSRSPRTPSITMCHWFLPWKALGYPEQRSNRSFFQPNQFPGIKTHTWKRLTAGTSALKALSSCITLKVPVKVNSDMTCSTKSFCCWYLLCIDTNLLWDWKLLHTSTLSERCNFKGKMQKLCGRTS